jgi:eukaryotic-like serine/threonine-protein kinase
MSEETLFSEALARPPAERAAFLDAACAGQPQLRAAVEALLAAHERSGNLLDKPRQPIVTGEYTPNPAAAPQVATTDYQPEVGPGVVIAGRYTLVEKIGEGGMGEVWVAKQTEPVKRRVALKLIKAGMDTKAVLQRFDAERQALAIMDHPNIAKVLDGGMTADRRPFFVMELVNGLPLTKFCDEAKLGIRERLELLTAICHAVQHAHQKGIIHRDLKPANILVTLIDARPVPKVIDFGVAKAIGGKLLDESLSTQFGAVVGTLEYMSPEQAGFSGNDIDTRADIYSLGVILYELLTGLRPIDSKRLKKAALTEMIRIIQEEEPSKPSTRLSTDEALPSLAASRHIEPKKLMALLRGELDWVVMKCLEKQRERRYETANALARDIQRYLADEMVEARPPSAGYRLRKFVRKHRAALTSAAAIAVLLVAGLSLSLWQMFQAIDAESKAVSEGEAKDLALAAEKKAREQAFAALRTMTDEVVERKFAAGQGHTLTDEDRAFLRGVIAQYDAFAAIQGDDADSRAVRAEGRARVGLMRYRLGELKEAEADFDAAIGLRKQLAADFPTRPEFRLDLASSHTNRGVLLQTTGRLKEAEADYYTALGILKQLAADFPTRPEFRLDLASSHNNRGNLLGGTGRLKEAEADYDAAVSIYNQLAADFPTRPEFRYELGMSHNNRGNLLGDTGRRKEAEADYDAALSIYKQLAADFPTRPQFRQELAASHNNRGVLLRDTDRLKEAEADYDAALGIQKQLAADFPTRPEFRRELAISHTTRGNLLVAAGRLKEADKDLSEALSIQKQLAADFPNQPDLRNELAGTCVNLAIFHQQQRDWATAKRLLLEGRPHHVAALKASLANPTYRQFYRNHLMVLTRVHAGLLESADAVRTAETRLGLGWDPPADAYDAAGFLSQCIPIVARHDQLDDTQRKDAARFYGDAAMKLLREAVSKGYKDTPRMKQDRALAPLHQREDFQKLVAELEGKKPEEPSPSR